MKHIIYLITTLFLCLIVLTAAPSCLLTPAYMTSPFLIPHIYPLPTETPVPTEEPLPFWTQEPASTPQPTPEPTDESFFLTLTGDCTLGTEHGKYGAPGTFVDVIGENYAYPFANVLEWTANDDFTLVNFEGTLTESQEASEKLFRFRAPQEYAQILVEGSVECVSLANNHTRDYGETGYLDTKDALLAHGIAYVEHESTTVYTTQRGLTIGLFAAHPTTTQSAIQNGIAQLKMQGAQLILCVFHLGEEGSYRPNDRQKEYAHIAIDAGAQLVVQHHPHVLQPIETYGGGVIFYSLGNFSFGGNSNPADKDTAMISQEVILHPDGSVSLGDTIPIPCRISGHSGYNDYQPTPYEADDPAYARVLSKLDGTFDGPNLVVSYNTTPAPDLSGSSLPDGWSPTVTPIPFGGTP